jgi:hypothetical protein
MLFFIYCYISGHHPDVPVTAAILLYTAPCAVVSCRRHFRRAADGEIVLAVVLPLSAACWFPHRRKVSPAGFATPLRRARLCLYSIFARLALRR